MKKLCKNCGKEVTNYSLRKGAFCCPKCYYNFKSPPKERQVTINITKKPIESQTIYINKVKSASKSKTHRDAKYMKFIRTFGCIICNSKPTNAHHSETGGISIKASDYSCVPLCASHHVNGSDAIHKIGNKSFEAKFKVNLKEIVVRFNKLYNTR